MATTRLCMLQRYELPFDKLRVDLAFEHAWRNWPDQCRSQFPQVSTDLRKGKDAVWVMTHADERKRTMVFLWEWTGGTLRIYGRTGDWDSDDPADVEYAVGVIDGNVPLDGWIALARDFLTDLES